MKVPRTRENEAAAVVVVRLARCRKDTATLLEAACMSCVVVCMGCVGRRSVSIGRRAVDSFRHMNDECPSDRRREGLVSDAASLLCC